MAGIFDIPQIRRQTDSPVQPFIYKDKNGAPIDISGASFFVQFRQGCVDGVVVREMSLGSGISFTTDGTDGAFQFDLFLLEWQADRYFYDIKSIISGSQKIRIKGTRIVIENTSKNS